MPPRKSKRQQREEDELLALSGAQDGDDTTDLVDEPLPARSTTVASAFASLAEPEDSDMTEEDAEKVAKVSKSAKKRKKKSNTQASSPPAQKPTSPASAPKSGKKGKAKAKEPDDFDAALAELSKKYAHMRTGDGAAALPTQDTSSAKQYCELLSVSLKHLDSAAELARFFGHKVVGSQQKQKQKPPPGRGAVGPAAKSVLVQVNQYWPPPASRDGMTAEQLNVADFRSRDVSSGPEKLSKDDVWWSIRYTLSYTMTCWRFVQAVGTMDPQNLVNLLQQSPWHADTLLQVSEYYKHREEHSTASDLIERALFAFERALSQFNFTTGMNRLDFQHAENRPFWLAMHRHIVNLERRGVSRTAFECARLMLSLDPWNDPHGANLHLDFLGIKAGMAKWVLDMWAAWSSVGRVGEGSASMDIRILPGWWYARAQAMWLEEGESKKSHEASTQALREAVYAFPEVVPLLADRADINLPGSVRSDPRFKVVLGETSGDIGTTAIQLLAHIYTDRAGSLWKQPEYQQFFLSVFSSNAPPPLSDDARRAARQHLGSHAHLTESIFRHASLFEGKRSFQSFIPSSARERVGYAWDPLPPKGVGATRYGPNFFADAGLPGIGGGGGIADMDGLMGRLRALWQQVPQLADIFPDPARFAELLQREPEEALGVLEGLRNAALNEENAQGDDNGVQLRFVDPEEADVNVPGALPAPQIEHEDDSENDEEQNEPHFAVRLMRNIPVIGQLFAAPAEQDSDEDE